MTVDDVKKRVAKLAAIKQDESAHSEEDALYIALLKAIANGTCDDPKQCAHEALKALEIDFERWYA